MSQNCCFKKPVCLILFYHPGLRPKVLMEEKGLARQFKSIKYFQAKLWTFYFGKPCNATKSKKVIFWKLIWENYSQKGEHINCIASESFEPLIRSFSLQGLIFNPSQGSKQLLMKFWSLTSKLELMGILKGVCNMPLVKMVSKKVRSSNI